MMDRTSMPQSPAAPDRMEGIGVTLFLHDLNMRKPFHEAWMTFLPSEPPARIAACVADANASLGGNAHFALDAIALAPKGPASRQGIKRTAATMNTVNGIPASRTVADAKGAPLTVFLCFCVAILEGFDLQIIGVTAPVLRAVLKLTPAQLGWIFSASLIGLAFGAAFGGWLADRVGRKPVLIGSMLALGAFTLGAVAADSFEALLLLRFLAGLGIGGAMPNLIAVVSEVAPKDKVTGTVSLMFCGMPLGGILVGLLARFGSQSLGWQGMFGVGGILPLIVAVLLAVNLKETGVRSAAAAKAPVRYLDNLFGSGIALRTLLLWLVFALTLLQLSLLLNWVPTLIVDRGFKPEEVFVTIMVINLGSIAGSFTIGRACDKFGVRWPMFFVYAAMAVSLALLAVVTAREVLWIVAAAAGYFVLGSQFVLYGLAPRLYDPHARGAGVGAAVAMGRIGAIAGPLLVGQALGAGARGSEVILFLVPMAVLAGAALFWLTFIASDALRKGSARAGH